MSDQITPPLEEVEAVPQYVASGRLGMETLVLRLATYAYALPAAVVLARTLGPSGRGAYQLAVTTSLIVLTIVLLGIPQSQFRSWGSRSTSELLAVSRLVAQAMGLVGFGVCAIVASGEADADAAWALLLMGASMPLQVHSACLVVVLQSAGRTRRVNVVFALAGFVQTTSILVLWSTGGLSVRTTAVAYVLGLAIQWVLLRSASRSLGRATPRMPVRAALSLARSGLVLQVFILAQFLLLRIDVLFLASIAGLGEVGIYAVAVTLAELVWLFTDSLAHTMVERTTHDSEGNVLTVFQQAVRMSLTLGITAGVITAAFAPLTVGVLFGAEFASAVPVVVLLVPGVVAMGVWRTLATAVVRFGSIWAQPGYASVALIANVVLNLLLIPSLGARGAAIASSLAYLLAASLSVRWLMRRTGGSLRDLRPGRAELRTVVRALPGRA